MRTNGIFETAHYTLQARLGQPFYLVFFGDVHAHAPNHCADTWGEFKAKFRHRRDCYFIGMGDYLDLMSASERFSVLCAKLHESTRITLQDFYKKLIDEFATQLDWMGDRLIGLLEGNHYVDFPSGITSTQYLADALSTRYLGVCCGLVLSIHAGTSSRHFRLALHHGRGAGRRAGAGFNTVEDMCRTFEGCDVYAMGDNHQRGGLPIQTFRLIHNARRDKPRLEQHNILLLRTGAFLRGYVPGKPSYVVDAQYPPSNLGWVEVEVTLSKPRVGDKSTDEREARITTRVIA